MESQIGWIDFSPTHRDRVRKFMDLMEAGGVVDELGVGVLRDTMSTKLFHGFSTLYTRAKYFFITPYILLERDALQKRNQKGQEYFRAAELETNLLISDFYRTHAERSGESYFGKNTPNGNLKRQPSTIYWNGMIQLHFVPDSSLDQVLADKPPQTNALLSDDAQGDGTTEETGEYRGSKDFNLSYDASWRREIQIHGLSLTRTEAETLQNRLQTCLPHGLPAALVTDEALWTLTQMPEVASDNPEDKMSNSFIRFVKRALPTIKDDILRQSLIDAYNLSLFLYGLHLAYNIQLWRTVCSEKADAFVEELRSLGKQWADELKKRIIDYPKFDVSNYMDGTVKQPTRQFLTKAQQVVFRTPNWEAMEVELGKLAEDQERWNKRAKSHFVKSEKEQDDEVNASTEPRLLGLALINYRYEATLRVVRDIYEGLNRKKS